MCIKHILASSWCSHKLYQDDSNTNPYFVFIFRSITESNLNKANIQAYVIDILKA